MHPLRFYLNNVLYRFLINHTKDKEIQVLFIGFDPSQNGENEKIFKNSRIKYDVVDPFEKKPKNFWGNLFIESKVDEYSKNTNIKYDLILSIGVLGYYNWPSEQIELYIESIKNLLSNNGHFILHSPIIRFTGMNSNWKKTSMPIEIFKNILKKYFNNDVNLINIYFEYIKNDNKKLVNTTKFRGVIVNKEYYQDYKDVIYIDNNYKKHKVDGTFKIFLLKKK